MLVDIVTLVIIMLILKDSIKEFVRSEECADVMGAVCGWVAAASRRFGMHVFFVALVLVYLAALVIYIVPMMPAYDEFLEITMLHLSSKLRFLCLIVKMLETS